jgi:hypothetical protein
MRASRVQHTPGVLEHTKQKMRKSPDMMNVDGRGSAIASGHIKMSFGNDFVSDRVVTDTMLTDFVKTHLYTEAKEIARSWFREIQKSRIIGLPWQKDDRRSGQDGRHGRDASLAAPGRGRSSSRHRAESMTRSQAESQVRDHLITYQVMGIGKQTAATNAQVSYIMANALRYKILDIFYEGGRNRDVLKSGGV